MIVASTVRVPSMNYKMKVQIFVVAFVALVLHGGAVAASSSAATAVAEEECNMYKGSWVYDKSYPLYKASSCTYLHHRDFDCLQAGRPDNMYLKYRWQPETCTLPSFDGRKLLTKLSGKKLMFIGDSLSANMHDSFMCLLLASVPEAKIVANGTRLIQFATFVDYNVTVVFYLSHFLVDIVEGKNGRVLNLNSIQAGHEWLVADILIFNTGHWWRVRGTSQPWDYIQDGKAIYKDMGRTLAFSKALATWAKWVDTNINQTAKRVIYQGITPNHYNGMTWGVNNASCMGQTVPSPPTIHAGPLPEETIVKNLLKNMSTPVYLLDITFLSLLRKDGHPSKYNGANFANDCTHWCLPGVPDTWSQILYAVLSK